MRSTPPAPTRPVPPRAVSTPTAWLRTALLAAAVLALGACDSLSNKFLDTVQGKIQLSCPSHNIIADASRRLTYQPGPGRDLIDIDNEIVITGVSLACDSSVNRESRSGSMTVTVRINMDAVRGPANRDRRADIEYFVSVTDRANKILYREAFTIKMAFAENESRREVTSPPVPLVIPIQAGQTGRNFRILVGLVLTREQLEMNRQDRRPRL